MTRDTSKSGITFISFVILAILGMQTYAVVIRSAWYWPFIDYPMYARSHYEGERVPVKYTINATLSDNKKVSLVHEDLDLNDWKFNYKFVYPVLRNDVKGMQELIEYYRNRTGKKIVRVEILDSGYRVTRDGLLETGPSVLAEMEAESARREENPRGIEP